MKLEILTPTHIGSGEKLLPTDYYPIKDMHGNITKIIVIDIDKLFNTLISMGVNVNEVVEILRESKSYPLTKIFEKYHLKPKDFEKYPLDIVGGYGKYSMQINTFIKTCGMPYIPGSSIKGAIRTALMYYIVKDNKKLLSDIINELNKIVTQKNAKNFVKRADDKLDKKIFGNDPKFDVLKSLIIRDSEKISLKKLKVYKVEILGNDAPIPTYIEGLENIKINFEMQINDAILKNVNFNGMLKNIDFELIKNAIREFSKAVINAEINEIYKYGKYKENMLKFYKNLEDKIEDGELFIRIGWGSGWYSTTIGVLLKTHPKFEELRKKLGLGKNPKTKKVVNDYPKTRRIVNNKPLGWVKLEGELWLI
ncbi:CRISPR-associated RAMP protein, Csm5 family [Methanocaldococcus vulcanius M7]|uniref:CRISPR system Cms protein Csm5 n=1 Tax=Methanocaldococcus vulcanius (strain ATCC 700851 / DSM 12094 / M7) TaxID=579137 RepID=C9RHN0_METVM|nr:type III-A CRISPR-associated RAMP protein Csm5 [Methanocaldococcus vulcanius]ACX73082.1 CRISPR-associated RAMP protein, Csm5 family [Methanocaldococcus vulcanius M7]